MSAALKRELVPSLRATGFAGTFPRYRRERPAAIDLLAVFFNKAGTHFFLEFGAHARGHKSTSWGEIVPEEMLMLEHVPFDQRARLQARSGASSMEADWFAFDSLPGDDQFRALAASIAALMPQVEAWLASGTAGPNVAPNDA